MYRLTDLHDTIVAQATPPGVGAIGVIRLSGPEALSIADGVFRHIKKGENLGKQPGHTAHFGHITDGERNLDEVLATVFRAPKSYTRQDTVEFSCHGSPYILQQVLQLLLRKGARLALPGEYTQRAFLNGQLDLSQAEAVADLIAADSEASHNLAMKQMRGGYSDDIRRLREQLIHFASLLELELDFAEEDVEFADRSHLKALLREILGYIDALLQSFTLGNALKAGISTVIAGRPNAGKSTLLNALLNEERAIVSDIAGTTRDTIEEVLNIRGVAFRLIDTAGIREAGDQIEAIGVQKTFEKVRQSAILMYVFDTATATADEVANDLKQLEHADMRTLLIANKIDLRPDWEQHFTKLSAPIVAVSAKEQLRVGVLKEQLYELVMQGNVANSSTIVSNARHFEALFKSSESLNDALRSLDTGVTTDFIAMDIRRGIHFLGEITGDISTEDLLGNIFSKFCIGK